MTRRKLFCRTFVQSRHADGPVSKGTSKMAKMAKMSKMTLLLVVAQLLCLSPWIFIVWWWPCNFYVSISSTLTAVACFVFSALISHLPKWGFQVKLVGTLIILLFSSFGIYGLVNGGTCDPVPFYTTIAYMSPICVVCLIMVFVTATVISIGLTYKPTEEDRRLWKNFKVSVFTVTTCVFATWLSLLWVFTCDALPDLPLSSTCFAVLLWLFTLGRLLKDHHTMSYNWRYAIFATEYSIMSSIFGVCIYLNLPLFYDATTCHDAVVILSLIIYILFGICLSALTFWYVLWICLFEINCCRLK